MLGLGEATVRRPAVADQHAAEVASEHVGGLLEAASVLDGVHADPGRGERPEPHELASDLPSRLIRAHHRCRSQRLDQRGVGRLSRRGEPVKGLAQATAADLDAEDGLVEIAALLEGEPQALVEVSPKRHGPRPELRGGGSHGIGRLPRMPPSNRFPAARALPQLDAKANHVRPQRWNLGLVLFAHLPGRDGATTFGADLRAGHLHGLVHVLRHRSPSRLPVVGTRPATRSPGIPLRPALRERRRLSLARAHRPFQ